MTARTYTFREFVNGMKVMVDNGWRNPTARPDTEWMPCAVIQGRDGMVVLHMPYMPNDDAGKDALTAKVAGVARARHARKVGLAQGIWRTTGYPPIIRPQDDPCREEGMLVVALDAECSEVWIAPVRRHDYLAPTLGPWEGPGEVAGRMVDPIVRALR